MKTSAERTVRGLSIALGVFFLIAGAAQVLEIPWIVQRFEEWGYPQVLRRLVGVIEILGAIALFSSRSASIGAIMLGSVMLGAVYTHLFRGGNPLFALVPGVLLAVLLHIGSRQLERAEAISMGGPRLQRPAAR